MARPTICRMCGEKFKPAGEEHICQPCIKEIDELELATPQPSPPTEEETNEQLNHH